jgi:hypothetical protein
MYQDMAVRRLAEQTNASAEQVAARSPHRVAAALAQESPLQGQRLQGRREPAVREHRCICNRGKEQAVKAVKVATLQSRKRYAKR